MSLSPASRMTAIPRNCLGCRHIAALKSDPYRWAEALGVPLAYLYADNSDLAEVILAFGLLPGREQRRLAAELKARVSPPAAKAGPARRAPATRRTR